MEIATHYGLIEKITVANEELMASIVTASNKPCKRIKKIQIEVDKDLVMKINKEIELTIKADTGLLVDYGDPEIFSLVAVTEGVAIKALLAYGV